MSSLAKVPDTLPNPSLPDVTPNPPDITFVCCVESGWLETQTVRMVESLRRWGGAFADVPVVAVTPRFGPPLSSKTLRAFDHLGVEYLRFRAQNPYAWKSFLNKHYAMAAVEERCTTEFLGWLDSDLLILGEPDQLRLSDDEDFAACAPDKNIGTAGPDDPFEPYWREACNVVGLELSDLPWVVTEREGIKIRLYWNSGVFVYRRATGFSKVHLDTTLKLLDAHIASAKAGVYFTQHTLGMAMVKMGLRWRALPHSHNYGMGTKTHARWYDPEKLRQAKILHYHDAMWMPFWDTFLQCLKDTHPDVATWLATQGPLVNSAPPQWKILSKGLNWLRQQKAAEYQQRCTVI